MALDSRKRIVIYGALSVVVLGVAVIGILAATGRLKIRADTATRIPPTDRPNYNDMSRWLLPGRWNLVTVPCQAGDKDFTYHFGSNYDNDSRLGYIARYDAGAGNLVSEKDIKGSSDPSKNYFSIGNAYWIKAKAVRDNVLWTSCPLPAGDVTVPLKVGEAVPVGNPFNDYLYNTGIKLVVDGKEIPLTTKGSASPDDNGALKQGLVQLAFYNAGEGTYTRVTEYNGFLVRPNGATELAPFAGFYVAVSLSLGNSQVGLKFLKSYTEKDWSVNANTPPCKDPCAATCDGAWGEKSDAMRASKARLLCPAAAAQ